MAEQPHDDDGHAIDDGGDEEGKDHERDSQLDQEEFEENNENGPMLLSKPKLNRTAKGKFKMENRQAQGSPKVVFSQVSSTGDKEKDEQLKKNKQIKGLIRSIANRDDDQHVAPVPVNQDLL